MDFIDPIEAFVRRSQFTGQFEAVVRMTKLGYQVIILAMLEVVRQCKNDICGAFAPRTLIPIFIYLPKTKALGLVRLVVVA